MVNNSKQLVLEQGVIDLSLLSFGSWIFTYVGV